MPNNLQIFEAILFIENRPLSADILQKKLGIDAEKLRALIDELNAKFETQESPLRVSKWGEGYCLSIIKTVATELFENYGYSKNNKFSKAMLETLSIVAYTQPITKSEIENFRGMQCSYIISLLLKEKLIEVAGKKSVPGNPLLYRTSEKFLHTFKLKSLKNLPQLDGHIDKIFS